MATSAILSKARSAPDRRAYEIISTSDADVRVTIPNDFGSAGVAVLIEPARIGRGGAFPPEYLASNWRISEDTTADEIVLQKTPAKGSSSAVPQAVAFVPVPEAESAAAPAASDAAPKSKKKKKQG